MPNSKIKSAIWLMPETKELVGRMYAADNCRSQSEFIEKAIRFYAGYLNTQNAAAFLPRVLAIVLNGALDNLGHRIGIQLNKVAIEQNMCNHLLAEDTDMDHRDYQLMRGRSVREVESTNGRISFRMCWTSRRQYNLWQSSYRKAATSHPAKQPGT